MNEWLFQNWQELTFDIRPTKLLNINQLNGIAKRITDDLRRHTGGDRKPKKWTEVLSRGHTRDEQPGYGSLEALVENRASIFRF